MADAAPVFEVWPENWETFVLFTRLETQWREDSMSGKRLGLDYAGVEALLRLHRVPKRAAVFEDLCAMERAALKAARDE